MAIQRFTGGSNSGSNNSRSLYGLSSKILDNSGTKQNPHGDAAVGMGQAQPRLGRKLEGAQGAVAYNVAVTDKELVGVRSLLRIRPGHWMKKDRRGWRGLGERGEGRKRGEGEKASILCRRPCMCIICVGAAKQVLNGDAKLSLHRWAGVEGNEWRGDGEVPTCRSTCGNMLRCERHPGKSPTHED